MKPRLFSLGLLTSLLILSACNKPAESTTTTPPLPTNKFDDPIIQRIYDLADRRMADSLRPYLHDSNAVYRREAARVMGSVQDSLAGPQLVRLLRDQDSATAQAAAWALGQIGDSSSMQQVVADISGAIGNLQVRMAEAIGKAGSKTQVEAAFRNTMTVQPIAMLRMLYRAGVRKIVPQGAATYALEHLSDPNSQHYAAAYLGRVADLGPITDPTSIITTLRSNSPDEVKQHLVKSLRRCDTPACTQELRILIQEPTQSPSVRVNALRAAGTVHPIAEEAMAAVLDANQQVAVTAAEHIRDNMQQDYATTLGHCRKVQTWRPRAILVAAAMADAVGHQDTKGRAAVTAYADSLYQYAGPYEKGALLSAFGKDFDQADRLFEIALKLEKIVSTYATEALIASREAFGARNQAPWITQLKQLVATGDPGIIAMAADHISGESQTANMVRIQVKDAAFLDSALLKLKLPADIEAYNAVEKAIAKINGMFQVKSIGGGVAPPLTHLHAQTFIDWALVKRIPTAQTAVVQTTKGKIVFRLQVEDAPGTVANFVKLVHDGFYNGKYFHRVVPAFVAQGGCPRGDGWGSTPETIRSEWPSLQYDAGVVGMASAGKDTESCQWFITHCSTPHLDGRYTIFARVVEGMDVVQSLEIGDSISSVELPGLVL